MSIPFTGILKGSSGGITSGIAKQVKLLNLKPVNRIVIKFDPFTPSCVETRTLLYYLSNPKIAETNPACRIRTEVLNNRSDPSVELKLSNGESFLFKSANLTALEMLKLFNLHITTLVPKDEPVTVFDLKSTKGLKAIKSKAKKR